MTSDQIRQQFLDYFAQKHGHTFVPSSPVVPHDDPTLLFTNAGMNQFKPIFLGQETRSYTRAVNTQKCIRAGGKHNDLDDVGRSRRHHTFFEMLGNWSFGDYFKRGAISMAWELLTKVWKLDPSRLHASCFEGNPAAGIPRDTESADLWKEIAGLPDDRIHYFGKDNFWEMGDTGPCGPCTEIYIDRTPGRTGGSEVNGNDPRVMEIWNLVFIQYNRDATGTLTPLPAQHVDTGMGFERICQVLQGKDDNFAIDLWKPLFDRISEISDLKYTGKFPRSNSTDPQAEAADPQLRHDIAFRVVADHIRCLTFALTDGAIPSNEGRGYVLRRILRRAVRFGRQQLELREPFLHKLVPVIIDSMGGAFPELKKDPQRVVELVRDEEVSFGKTLERGIQLFDEAARVGQISAADAFKLHDTYGFPIDLTRIMAEERGLAVDIPGYETLMEKAKELARTGGKTDAGRKLADLSPDVLAQLKQMGVGPTDDQPKFGHEPVSAKVLAIWNGTDLGSSPLEAGDDEQLAIILDRTSFYAEMGGQVGDAGTLTAPTSLDLGETKRATASVFDVETTKVVGGYVLHIGRLRSGKIAVGETVTAMVAERRELTEKNHTSTHLANWALRETLGDDVQQKGSLVDPEKLRFDFSHGSALTDEQLGKIESLVSAAIEKKLRVDTQNAPQEQALKIAGLRAVFGEKYPPMVRVVSIGAKVADLLADPGNPQWRQYSIEFCGGTHLPGSADAGAFAIVGEESVSKGIRRITALTGDAAGAALQASAAMDAELKRAQLTSDEELPGAIATINRSLAGFGLPLRAKRRAQAAVAELQARQKELSKSGSRQSDDSQIDTSALAAELLASAVDLAPGKLVVADVPGAAEPQLLALIDSLKKRAGGNGIAILLGSAQATKVAFAAAVSDDLIARGLKAGDWIRETAKVAGGGGGGRPQMAQAGGKDPAKLPSALETARQYAARTLLS